ncbi:MAG: hypothetical protein GC164_01240 [Phycisphaera sp.]|nr:hypothetical protein [Phycisphaera sp.]
MFNQLREWLNKNSAMVTIVAVGLLCVSLGAIILQSSGRRGGPRVVDVYYFDLSSGKVITAKSDQFPPIDTGSPNTPEGMPPGVRAYLFACGECPSSLVGMTPEQLAAKKVYIGWLEAYTPDAKAKLEDMRDHPEKYNDPAMYDPMMEDFYNTGMLVRTMLPLAIDTKGTLAGDKWFPGNSEPAMMIMDGTQRACGDAQLPTPCFPKR